MKFTSAALLAAVGPLASAFPASIFEAISNDPALVERVTSSALVEGSEHQQKRQAGAGSAQSIFEAIPTFDAKSQYIDVSKGSGHEWVAPKKGDLRGVCPGLNAMANHGFLPHNGYASIAQYIQATNTVVGMGLDLAAFLAVLGALIDSGDLNHWSMGGTPGPGIGGPAAKNGHGLIGSHNKYENDVSPTRPDLYESGNNYITQASQFQDMINYSPGGFVTMESLAEYRAYRFNHSLYNNKYFFNGPFPGLLVQPAAFTFIYRFMANHSADYPYGQLSYSTIKSWFGITGKNGHYKAPFGYERIPDNWYRRSHTAPYSIPYFLGDVVAYAGLHPEFLDIGGNLDGKTNNFAGVDVANLTGGVYNSKDLLKGNNLGCFAFQTVAQIRADAIAGPILTRFQNILGGAIKALGCPTLEKYDTADLNNFPGYQKAPEFSSKKLKVREVGSEE